MHAFAHALLSPGVIFVVDTSDKIRMVLVKDELALLIQNKELQVRCCFWGGGIVKVAECVVIVSSVRP